MPQLARISGAPGKNLTHAEAAAVRTTSTNSNCFQAAINTPVAGEALFAPGAGTTKLDAKQQNPRRAPRSKNPYRSLMTILRL